MPGILGTPGGTSPNQVGQFYIPPSEWPPPNYEEDSYLPSILPNLAVGSLLLASSLLVGIADSTTEEYPVPTAYEEDSWIPPVLVNKSYISLLVGSTNSATTTLNVDEDYQHKAPAIWPTVQIRLSWGDDGNDLGTSIVVDESEFLPSSTKSSWLNSASRLAKGIDEDIEVIVDDTEWIPKATLTKWQALVVIDTDGDFTQAPVVPIFEDDTYLPPIFRPVTSTQLLYGTSAPVIATVSIVDEFEQIQLYKFTSLWHPTIVSEPSSEWIPPVVATSIFEEDSWLSPVHKPVINVQLLCSTSGPTAQAINVVEDSEQPRLSKFVSLWYPRIVSDPTDNPVPIVNGIEEEPQLVILAPPTILYAITPWSYSTEDISSTEQIDDDYWIKPSKLVSLWRPSIVSDPTDNVVPVALAIDEEPQLISLVPPPIIYAITTWSYGAEDIGGSIPEEDYWQRLVKPIAPYLDARFVGRIDEVVIPAVIIVIDDDSFKPAILPRQVLNSLSLWSREQNEVSVQNQLTESEYWYVYVSPVGKFVLPSQWQFEQHEFIVFVPPPPPPPPICFVTPAGITFSTESPSGVVVILEGPAQIVISNELLLNTTFVIESPSSISLLPNSPTPTECDD